MRLPLFSLPMLMMPAFAQAANFSGDSLSLLWGLPFAAILFSIALGPLMMPKIWHYHFG